MGVLKYYDTATGTWKALAQGPKGDKGDKGDTGPAGPGSGDVIGAASATDGNVAMFDGTTGKLLKDSGITLAGSNTGDETTATIKTKLGITTLSGSNTGDQTTVTGSAGSLKSPSTTGVGQLTGMAAGTTRVYTVPNANATLLTSAAAVTVAQGGTGATTLTGILKGNGTSAVTAVTAPTGAIVGTTDAQTLSAKTLTTPKVDTIYEETVANGVTVDGLNIKDGKLNTNDSVVTANITNAAVTAAKTSFGGNYSTSEVMTGFTWVDGSAIFKKTISFGTLPNATSKSVAHGISSLGTIIDVSGWGGGSGAYIGIPNVSTSSFTYNIAINADSTNIVVVTGSDRSSLSAYITMLYTKVA